MAVAFLLTAIKRIQYYVWRQAQRSMHESRRATKAQEAAKQVQAGPDNQEPDTQATDSMSEGQSALKQANLKIESGSGQLIPAVRAPNRVGSNIFADSSRQVTYALPSSSGSGSRADCVAQIRIPPGGIASYDGTASGSRQRATLTTAPVSSVHAAMQLLVTRSTCGMEPPAASKDGNQI